MKQYLLSVCYPADGTQPPPAVLNQIKSDVMALQKEMLSAGVWVFSGGLHAPDSATVLRHQNGDLVLTDRPRNVLASVSGDAGHYRSSPSW